MYRIAGYQPVTRDVFACHTYDAAQRLLGRYLARYQNGVWSIGRIVETECYTADDPACHAYRGKTKRNAWLFGPVGHAYVYSIYGIHACCNVVAYDAAQQLAGGVLIRAIEPVIGIEVMFQRRCLDPNIPSVRVANGPGKLTQALAIDTNCDGYDMCGETPLLILEDAEYVLPEITFSSRVGISRATDLQWRFVIPGNPFVSR